LPAGDVEIVFGEGVPRGGHRSRRCSAAG
jgi:hypothetical protein